MELILRSRTVGLGLEPDVGVARDRAEPPSVLTGLPLEPWRVRLSTAPSGCQALGLAVSDTRDL